MLTIKLLPKSKQAMQQALKDFKQASLIPRSEFTTIENDVNRFFNKLNREIN